MERMEARMTGRQRPDEQSWHAQGGADRITSVAIPLAFVGVGGFLLFGGLANMVRGVGKRDQ